MLTREAVAIGYDRRGRLIELIAALRPFGTVLFHANTPPSTPAPTSWGCTSRAVAGLLGAATLASFVVAVLLFALVIVLGVTSFNFVKHRMGGRVWKNVQRLAYPFFGLAWVHLMFMLAPAASKGGEQALFSVVIYSVVFGAYLVLRLYRAYKDKQAEAAEAV